MPPHAAPKTRKTALLREECLAAAARIFAEKGLAGTKLQDIASAVGISRTALYYHFASKEAILEALVDAVTFTVQKAAAEIALRQDLEPPEMLSAAVEGYAEWLLSHALEFRVIDRTEGDFPPDLAQVHRRAKRDLLGHYIAIIERGRDQGYFTVDEPRLAAFAIIGMCNWGAWWFKPDGSRSARELAQFLARFALNAVGAGRHAGPGPTGVGDALRLLRGDMDLLEQLLSGGGKEHQPAH